ncbi:uncharacterized protein [Primulina huaijiensis]|uniref:uncharacterized protein n=1 Tax=Primulina huaijiensis TaxID=1492673 RepID=UPI003CC78EE3
MRVAVLGFRENLENPMAMAAETEKPIQDELSLRIFLAERVIKSAQEAESFKLESSELASQVVELSHLLRSAARLTSNPAGAYDRPIRRVMDDLNKTLERALTLTRKCRHKKTNVIRHVFSITTATDFRKVSGLLDSSLADIKWALSIFSQDSDSGTIDLTLPPIATNDPILAMVWPYIAAVHMGRTEGAKELASLTRDNDRNKKIVVDEKGIPPLLKLLKESKNLDAQKAAARALCNLADDLDRVRLISSALGVQVVAKALSEAPMSVQVELVELVSRMSETDVEAQEEFGKENVTRPLVALLGMDVSIEEFKDTNSQKTANSIHSLVLINKEMEKKWVGGKGSGSSFDGSRHLDQNKKEKERYAELPEVRSSLKVSCATALWKLARGSLSNSTRITETKALLVLAKIIEKERGDLQINSLLVVMELASVAENNSDLKRAAFKPTSPAAKAVLDQLLMVINEGTGVPLLIPAIKAIGCLAKMFPAKETRIITPLVTQLSHRNPDVSAEAATALSKFICEDNFNRLENSKVIIESNGVPMLMNLLRSNDRGNLHLPELVLLCNLAINVGNSKILEQARALSVLEGMARQAASHNPDLRDLFAKAIHQLMLYQPAAHHIHRHP